MSASYFQTVALILIKSRLGEEIGRLDVDLFVSFVNLSIKDSIEVAIAAVGVIALYYYKKKQEQEADDYLQLVIGAPSKEQVSITNPNRPAVARKAPVRVPVKRAPVKKTAVRPVVTKQTVPVKPAAALPTTLGGQILNTIGPSLTGLQKYTQQRNAAFIDEFIHPSNATCPEGHLDPEEIKHAVIEGLKHPKISGIP